MDSIYVFCSVGKHYKKKSIFFSMHILWLAFNDEFIIRKYLLITFSYSFSKKTKEHSIVKKKDHICLKTASPDWKRMSYVPEYTFKTIFKPYNLEWGLPGSNFDSE